MNQDAYVPVNKVSSGEVDVGVRHTKQYDGRSAYAVVARGGKLAEHIWPEQASEVWVVFGRDSFLHGHHTMQGRFHFLGCR